MTDRGRKSLGSGVPSTPAPKKKVPRKRLNEQKRRRPDKIELERVLKARVGPKTLQNHARKAESRQRADQYERALRAAIDFANKQMRVPTCSEVELVDRTPPENTTKVAYRDWNGERRLGRPLEIVEGRHRFLVLQRLYNHKQALSAFVAVPFSRVIA